MEFDEKYRKLFEAQIDQINKAIDVLREIGAQIHDSSDFDFAVDYVRYSQAQDKIIVKFKEAIKDEN